MADSVYDGPGAYDEAAPYEEPFTSTVHLAGHANKHPLAKVTEDAKVII